MSEQSSKPEFDNRAARPIEELESIMQEAERLGEKGCGPVLETGGETAEQHFLRTLRDRVFCYLAERPYVDYAGWKKESALAAVQYAESVAAAVRRGLFKQSDDAPPVLSPKAFHLIISIRQDWIRRLMIFRASAATSLEVREHENVVESIFGAADSSFYLLESIAEQLGFPRAVCICNVDDVYERGEPFFVVACIRDPFPRPVCYFALNADNGEAALTRCVELAVFPNYRLRLIGVAENEGASEKLVTNFEDHLKAQREESKQ